MAVGVQAALGYEFRPPNRFQRLNQKLASTKGGAWLFSKTLQTLDRFVHRVSRHRTSASELLAGLPVVRITTIGRRSGRPRLAPLIAMPIDDDLALLGTNFGSASTPAWVHNLLAEPAAKAAYREREIDVIARAATAEEVERVFATSGGLYGGYEKYRERITGREIKVFVLTEA